MRMIIRPLRQTFPLSPIRIFTLARANDDPSTIANPSPHDTSPGQPYPSPAEV